MRSWPNQATSSFPAGPLVVFSSVATNKQYSIKHTQASCNQSLESRGLQQSVSLHNTLRNTDAHRFATFTFTNEGAAGGEAEREVEARAMLREADTNEDGKIRCAIHEQLLRWSQMPVLAHS